MTILVTGAQGMIGSQLVLGLREAGYEVVGLDKNCEDLRQEGCCLYRTDLGDKEKLRSIIDENKVDRIIHLAALAHTLHEEDLSWSRYYHINVECAKNVFDAAGGLPVLFISTVDVIGFYDGNSPVNGNTEIHPISKYGKSKALAEAECRSLNHYSIFRLSPVYTATIRRDIQKRYYLKYPTIAYQVGKGTAYEILDIRRAVRTMVEWCGTEPKNDITILKDEKPMWTPEYIRKERADGRAKIVLWFPKWLVKGGYYFLLSIWGRNEKTYLLNKAVFPVRSE